MTAWLMEIAGVSVVAGSMAYVWPPAGFVVAGLYLVVAANTRGR